MTSETGSNVEIKIVPVTPFGFPDFRELLEYRDLLYFLIWRNIRVAYAQSVGGLGWAVVQPALQVLIFSLVFGGLLKLDPGDGVPYPLFSTAAVIPWTYMSGAMSMGSSALVSNSGMLGKIYFPRLIFLLNPTLGGLVNFFISLFFMIAVMVFYQVEVTSQLLFFPALVVLMVLTPLGISLWLSSLTIRFRDMRIMMSHLIRALVYFVPVMYPSSQVPDHLRQWYIINPFVGIVEGYRSCLLGEAMHWDSLAWSIGVALVLLITGAIYFRRMERIIVDVI
ncbi:MAG: ABC transporter permease [Gammaproteobacteria bacterium]|jgi:lipopolysaccharide transport system permease protein